MIPKYAGQPVVIAGETYVLPGLPLDYLRRFCVPGSPEYIDVDAKDYMSAFDARAKIVLLALQRNYPDFDRSVQLTPGEIADLYDIVDEQTVARGTVKAPKTQDQSTLGGSTQK